MSPLDIHSGLSCSLVKVHCIFLEVAESDTGLRGGLALSATGRMEHYRFYREFVTFTLIFYVSLLATGCLINIAGQCIDKVLYYSAFQLKVRLAY